MKRKIPIIAILASLVALSACNTVKGLGRDIESVGEAGDKVVKADTDRDTRPAR